MKNAIYRIATLGFLFVLTLSSTGVAVENRPNIILVMTDDQGYPDLACHGHPFLKTPHIDELYRQSTRFHDFHVSASCAPTRAALMSGKHPFKVGVSHTAEARCKMNASALIIPQVLKSAGYTSGIFGKWHLGGPAIYQPENRGFDEVFIHGGGGIAVGQPRSEDPTKKGKLNGYYDPILKHNARFVQTTGWCTDVFFQQSLRWIKEQADNKQPFFAYIVPNAPHAPFNISDEYAKRYKGKCPKGQAAFYGMITNIDDNMGLLMKKLDEWDLADNTVLIFMTDNGSSGGADVYNAGMRGRKGYNTAGGTRVPFIIRWPNKIQAGVDVNRLARHYDVLPTLADIADAKIPADTNLDGKSLMPLIKDPKAPNWEDRLSFIHTCKWDTGRKEDDKYINFAVRNETWRLNAPSTKDKSTLKKKNQASGRWPAEPVVSLYHVDDDIGETNDLQSENMEVVTEMLKQYEAWWAEMDRYLINEDKDKKREKGIFGTGLRQQMETEGLDTWEPPQL